MDGSSLTDLFQDSGVIDRLSELNAQLSLGIVDHSPERAAVVQRLNRAGIPVIAWQLLPMDQGYWYHMCNATEAISRYDDFSHWSKSEGLKWAGIGVDIEPDIHEFQHLLINKRQLIHTLFKRGCSKKRLISAQFQYRELITRMQADGYRVDSYEFPFMQDERHMGATLLQRLTGIMDVPADRRVVMLYTSFFRPYGPAVLWDYAQHSQSVGVGLTGGGVEMEGIDPKPPLDWNEFSRDLLLAHRWVDDIHVFSLEGCIRQGFLQRLVDFDWERPAMPPHPWSELVVIVRKLMRMGLWLSARPTLLLFIALTIVAWSIA